MRLMKHMEEFIVERVINHNREKGGHKMARGYFRTSKDMCLYCGARSTQTKIYKRGQKRQPDYICERCFDRSATEEEKKNKEKLQVKE